MVYSLKSKSSYVRNLIFDQENGISNVLAPVIHSELKTGNLQYKQKHDYVNAMYFLIP